MTYCRERAADEDRATQTATVRLLATAELERHYNTQVARLLHSGDPRALAVYVSLIGDVIASPDPTDLFADGRLIDGAFMVEGLFRNEQDRAAARLFSATLNLPPLAMRRWQIWRAIEATDTEHEVGPYLHAARESLMGCLQAGWRPDEGLAILPVDVRDELAGP